MIKRATPVRQKSTPTAPATLVTPPSTNGATTETEFTPVEEVTIISITEEVIEIVPIDDDSDQTEVSNDKNTINWTDKDKEKVKKEKEKAKSKKAAEKKKEKAKKEKVKEKAKAKAKKEKEKKKEKAKKAKASAKKKKKSKKKK